MDVSQLPGAIELRAILAAFVASRGGARVVVQCQDLAFPVVNEVTRSVAAQTRRSVSVELARTIPVDGREMEPSWGRSWRLLVDGEVVSSGYVQPFGDDAQPG